MIKIPSSQSHVDSLFNGCTNLLTYSPQGMKVSERTYHFLYFFKYSVFLFSSYFTILNFIWCYKQKFKYIDFDKIKKKQLLNYSLTCDIRRKKSHTLKITVKC